jgi:hypothetical protein
VVHADPLGNGPVGQALGGQQDDPRPLCGSGLDGVRTNPPLQLGSDLVADLKRR